MNSNINLTNGTLDHPPPRLPFQYPTSPTIRSRIERQNEVNTQLRRLIWQSPTLHHLPPAPQPPPLLPTTTKPVPADPESEYITAVLNEEFPDPEIRDSEAPPLNRLCGGWSWSWGAAVLMLVLGLLWESVLWGLYVCMGVIWIVWVVER